MIRIVLLGRTGNHLFQYALGRVLARKHGVPLVMDASWFNAEGWAEVSHFLKLPLKAKVVRRFSLASRALRNFSGRHYWEFRSCPFLREAVDDQSFDPRFLDAPADCVLFGYFQTPRYFESMAGELRNEFNDLIQRGAHASRVPPSAPRGRDWKTTLTQPTSVAVHVRRGDYLHHPEFQVCDQTYYQQAMDQMRSRVPNARFFVFSDDPAWCRETFTNADTEVVDAGPVEAITDRRESKEEEEAATNDRRHGRHGRHHRNPSPLHDLHLMSLASHHIIANSTYSWWAAWIGQKPGQIVMMPDRWYAGDRPRAPIAEKRGGGHWEVA